MKQIVAIFLALTFAIGIRGQIPAVRHQPSSSVDDIKDQFSPIPVGTFVEVKFTDHSKIRGYISVVESDGFSLRIGKAATGLVRQSAFADVKSVRVVKLSHTPAWAWIATGVIVGAVIVVVAVFLAAVHNA